MPSSRFKTFALLVYTVAALALIAALVSAPAHAQALPTDSVYPATSNSNTWTYSGGTATSSNASTLSFPPAANGPITTSTTQAQSVGSGKSIPIVIKSRPSPAVIAKAIGSFAAKTVGVLAVGKALYDLCNELGFNCSRTEADPPGITIGETTSLWNHVAGNSCGFGNGWSTQQIVNKMAACYGGTAAQVEIIDFGYQGWWLFRSATGVESYWQRASTSTQPRSLQQLEDAIAAKSGWPDSSAIGRTLSEAIASGVPLPLPAPYEITGPTTVPMSPTVTTYPDGSKVTDTPTKQVAYSPTTVTVTQTNTRTTTDPSGVTTPVSTVTTADPLPTPTTSPSTDLQTCGYPGGPACKIDETGTTTTPTKDGQTELTDGKKLLDDTLDTIKDKSNKDTSWGIVPTWLQSGASCHPVVLMTFPEFLANKQITLDICPHLDMIYLLMNALWIVWTFSAVLTMVRGSTTAGAV